MMRYISIVFMSLIAQQVEFSRESQSNMNVAAIPILVLTIVVVLVFVSTFPKAFVSNDEFTYG